MTGGLDTVRWSDPHVGIPAFLTISTIPFTFSIATGLSFGLISSALLKIVTGQSKRQDWLLHALALLCVARFAYLSNA